MQEINQDTNHSFEEKIQMKLKWSQMWNRPSQQNRDCVANKDNEQNEYGHVDAHKTRRLTSWIGRLHTDEKVGGEE